MTIRKRLFNLLVKFLIWGKGWILPFTFARMLLRPELFGLPLLVSASLLHSVEADENSVKILATHFPPFSINSEMSIHRGTDVEVVTAAFQEAGLKVEIEFYPWARAVELVEDGQADGLLSCSGTPDRRAQFYLSDPISELTIAYFVRADYDEAIPERLTDLKQRYVAVVRGYSLEPALRNLGARVIPVNSDRSALQMLDEQRVDLLVVEERNARYLLSQMETESSFESFPISEIPPTTLHVCLRKTLPNVQDWINRFNKGLSRIRESGLYEQIQERYR